MLKKIKFKNSKIRKLKIRKLTGFFDEYKFNSRFFDCKINKIVIIMCSREGQYQEFICEGKKFEDKCEKWTERLEEYYKYETNQ